MRIVVVRGKPPLAPNPYTSILKMQPCLLSQPKVGRRVATTTDYANDDWDDFDDDNDYEDHICGFKETCSSLTDENVMKSEMITGVPADSNWLHENFDED